MTSSTTSLPKPSDAEESAEPPLPCGIGARHDRMTAFDLCAPKDDATFSRVHVWGQPPLAPQPRAPQPLAPQSLAPQSPGKSTCTAHIALPSPACIDYTFAMARPAPSYFPFSLNSAPLVDREHEYL